MKGGKIKKLRKRLFEENPDCPFCGVRMILPEDVGFELKPNKNDNLREVLKKNPDNLCTIEHLYSRLNPLRNTPNPLGEKRRIICCVKCNNARGKQEELALGKEALKERAKAKHNSKISTN